MTAPLQTFKTQLDAVAYLVDAGYKVSKSQFNRAVKARKVPLNADGHFEAPALLGYAAANLTPAGQAADAALADATTSKLSADAELKAIQTARQRLRYQKEQGLLMPRAEHERDLAARALFFRAEVRNFIHLHGAAIIALTGGDEARLRDLVTWWEDKTALWIDAWSQEREYLLPESPEDEADAATAPDTAQNAPSHAPEGGDE